MTNVATVGVNDHKAHITKFGGSSRILINKAAPTDMISARTEKMAALFVPASFVNIELDNLSPAEEAAGCACLVAGSRPGSDP
jgi:hypothetical protein